MNYYIKVLPLNKNISLAYFADSEGIDGMNTSSLRISSRLPLLSRCDRVSRADHSFSNLHTRLSSATWLVQQSLTEVIGTILVLFWVLCRRNICVPSRRLPSGLQVFVTTSASCQKSLMINGKFHLRPTRTFSTLCRTSSMRYFLPVSEVLTVLACAASYASRRILLIRCGARCLYSGTSSIHKCQSQSLSLFEHRECHTNSGTSS